MLAAMQGNPAMFPPITSPPNDCPTSDLRTLSNPVLPTSVNYTSGAPQMIPVAMVPPPHILIGPGTNYTILPSIATASSEGTFGNLQFAGSTQTDSKTAVPAPTAYYPSLSSSEGTGTFAPLTSTAQAHSMEPQVDPPQPQSGSHVEVKPPFILTTSSTSPGLDRGTSSSDPQLTEHHIRPESAEGMSRRHKRKKHSRRRRHHERDQNPSVSGHESEAEGSPTKIIKEETEQTPSCSQDGGTRSADPSPAAMISYPVQALVDIPMNPPLTRSSRTSSLSSSLSSFRFGGSLSQLWASQMSLTARLPNMKSTGNLNAETATMPSLGNQYFAFGGSLPELSLTSLSRLLPSSSASDPNSSSHPGVFTLLHPPLYVYPSQQHLTTPFINANGSISFGSFLSGGSSLCNTQKATPATSEGSEGASDSTPDAPSSSIITGSENAVEEGGYSKIESSNTSSSNSGTKVPMFAPVAAGSMLGQPQVLTTLPAFHTIASPDCTLPHSNGVTSPNHSTSSHSNSPSHVAAPNLDTLACVATTPHHQLASPVSPHTLSQHHMLHTSQGGSPLQPHPHIDSKEGILNMSAHYMGRPGVIQSSGPIPMPGIKLEREVQVAPNVVKLAHGSPHAIPVISMPITECRDPLHTITASHTDAHSSHTVTSLPPEHLPPNSGAIETSPKREKDKPYKCDHPGCDRSFSFPAHLRSHVQQIHISYRPCKCDFPSCGKRFYTPQHLNVHKRVHTGERPFVCPYTDCSKAFTTAGNLKNHIRTHTGERPYSCKFEGCTKSFAEMSSLKKHELTHTGEKPYKCRVCGKAFSQAGSRNTHERKHNRTDDGDGDSGSKGPRRFRIKRVASSSDSSLIKPEPLL